MTNLTSASVNNMTDAQRKAFLRKLMGPPKRVITDVEKEHLMLLLTMMTPISESNNQRSWSETYQIGDTYYELTTFSADDTILEEILKEDT